MSRLFDILFAGKAFSFAETVCIEVYYRLFRTAKRDISLRRKGSFAARCGAFENPVEAMLLTDMYLHLLPEMIGCSVDGIALPASFVASDR